MASNFHRNLIEINPELEALRNKGLEQNAKETYDWISNLIRRTSNIHAAFLFENLKTLQNLCLFIGETQNKITDAGWNKFGYYLGLSPCLLKVICHNNINNEDPCYNVLLAYVQNENASLGKIIEALYLMGRIDVLSRMKNSFNDLVDIILQCNISSNNHSVEDTSDYESLPISEGCSQISDTSLNNSVQEIFLKPKIIPSAPFVFQNIKDNSDLSSIKIQQALNNLISKDYTVNYSVTERNQDKITKKIICNDTFMKNQEIKLLHEPLCTKGNNSNEKENLNDSKKKKYGIKIFLTFAEDGKKYACEIAKKLRQKRENGSSIGVLILGEHSEHVNMDPQQFIQGAFHQVDYICPIITRGYYKLIMKKEKVQSMAPGLIDAFYAPYIYRLMNSYFVSNNCLNDKIRCITPEDTFLSTSYNFLLSNPIFGVWVNISEIDDLAVRLLKNKKNHINL